MTDLERLIDQAAACVLSMKGAADDFVAALHGLKAASRKCEEDLAAKQAKADEQIAGARADLQQIHDERKKARRELELANHEVEKAEKKVEHLKDEYRKIFDRVLG